MTVEGITNQAQVFPEQFPGQKKDPPSVASTLPIGFAGNAPVVEDTFTPSAVGKFASEPPLNAGIFPVRQEVLTAAQSNTPFAQTNLSSNQNGDSSAQTAFAGTATAGVSQTVAQTYPAAAPGTNLSAAAPPGETTTNRASTPSVQNRIQTLNATLPVFGLSKADIREIDSLALQAGNFNPLSYFGLESQLEALARQALQQSLTNPGVSGIPDASATGNSSSNASGASLLAQGEGIQLTGIPSTLNHLSVIGGSSGTSPNNGQNPANGSQTIQVPGFPSNGAAQAVQVQFPPQNTDAGTADPKTPRIPNTSGT